MIKDSIFVSVLEFQNLRHLLNKFFKSRQATIPKSRHKDIDMITSIDNAEHYNWGENCDGWHLLKSDSLSLIQERMPPGTSEQLHYHHRAQQVFYILSGNAKFIVDGIEQLVGVGQSIHLAKG